MIITKFQKKLLVLLIIMYSIDALITIYGVTLYPGLFYEMNPLFARFLAISPLSLILAIIIGKILAAAFVILGTHYFNTVKDWRNNGERWGNTFCGWSVVMNAGILASLGWMNLGVLL